MSVHGRTSVCVTRLGRLEIRIKYCQTEFCCSCFGRERLNPPVFQFRILTPLNSEQTWTATKEGVLGRGEMEMESTLSHENLFIERAFA